MTDDSAVLFRTNEPYAEEIHHLIEIGMLIPVETDPRPDRDRLARLLFDRFYDQMGWDWNDPETRELAGDDADVVLAWFVAGGDG